MSYKTQEPPKTNEGFVVTSMGYGLSRDSGVSEYRMPKILNNTDLLVKESDKTSRQEPRALTLDEIDIDIVYRRILRQGE